MRIRILSAAVLLVAALTVTACAGTRGEGAPAAANTTAAATPSIDCALAENHELPDCGYNLTGTEAPQPGQKPMDEAAAISAATAEFGAPEGAKTETKLIPFSDWPAEYGGSDFPAVDRDRPVWVVNVYAQAKSRLTGPAGGAAPRPSNGYSVLLDAYSGKLLEYVSAPTSLG